MMRSKVAWLMIAALTAAPAWASDKQDFQACDGRIDPGKQPDGMRTTVDRQRFGGFMQEPQTVDPEACSRALASDRLLPT